MSTLLRMLSGVDVEVAEEAKHGTEFADAAFVQQRAQANPLGVAVDHERLADFDAGAGADGEQGLRFGDGEAERLFAEHMLARLSGFDGPGHVHVVRQRVVDGVDVGIGEQLFV